MNDELQKELARYLAGLRQSTEGVKDFVVEQAPGVVQEWVALGRIQYGAGAVLSLVVLIALVVLIVKLTRLAWAEKGPFKDDPDVWYCFGLPAGIVATIGLSAAMLASLYWWAVAYFAPKIYVIYSIADLIKK